MTKRGKNHGGYHGEQIEISSVLNEIKSAAAQHGWQREVFGSVDDFDLMALNRPPLTISESTRRIYISTGIHGDEPAGPSAALRLVQGNAWPADAHIYLIPCLNPVGFKNGTRENSVRLDLNRDYLNPASIEIRAHIEWLKAQRAFDICICLHEDWESLGFYLYELNIGGQDKSRADQIIRAVETVCPIDPSPVIEGRAARGGIIVPSLDPRTRPLWPESYWLIQNLTPLAYTVEAPSDFAMEVRVSALVAAVKAAIEA